MTVYRGIIFSIIISIFAYYCDFMMQENDVFSIGSSTLAFIIGAILAQFLTGLEEGGKWMTSELMPVVIIMLGFGLNLELFLQPEIGFKGILIAFISAFSCMCFCYLYGTRIGLDKSSSFAMGAGGAICGNSAVLAVSGPLRLEEKNVAVTLSVVNIMGFLTFILVPILSSLLGFSEIDSGIWAGSTIHAVPQAVAAGESIGGEALIVATAVKLARVSLLILIVPLSVYLGNKMNKHETENIGDFSLPLFVPGFISAAILSTWLIPENLAELIAQLGSHLLIPLLAAVGFFISKESLTDIGGKMLILGILSTLLMVIITYLLLMII
tara:strand:+ start:52766 stop:53743 length:978 start_codon:yes stop_codon:yes gene_type:complete